jgi:DNA polymerase-1
MVFLDDPGNLDILERHRDLLMTIMIELVGIDPNTITMQPFKDESDFVYYLNKDNPNVVIICGEKPLNDVFHVHGITSQSGRIRDYGGFNVMPLPSPGYLINTPTKLETYVDTVMTAYHCAIGVQRQEIKNVFEVVQLKEYLKYFIPYFKSSAICSFDFETSEIGDMTTFAPDFKIKTLALSFQQGSAIVIPINELSPFELSGIVRILNDEIFGDPSILKLGHNVKFDMHCAANIGITKFFGPFHDTMLMHQLLDENIPHGLKSIVRTELPMFSNYEAPSLEYGNWNDIPFDILAQRNALDSDLTLRLYVILTDYMLQNEPRLYNLYRNLTAPATVALFHAENNGMLINKKYLEEQIEETKHIIEAHEEKMRNHSIVKKFCAKQQEYKTAQKLVELKHKIDLDEIKIFKSKAANTHKDERIEGLQKMIADIKTGKIPVEIEKLNFGSWVQMNELLYSKDGFNFDRPIDPMTGESKVGTGKEVILYIEDKTGFIDDLLAFRQMNKVLNTYLKGIYTKLDHNNYIHTNFNQHIIITGRLSSDKPNLQNVITRTKYKSVEDLVKVVKNSFVCPEGYTLVSADYSQAELRLIAHFSQDTNMLEAFKNGVDIHENTAALVRGLTIEKFKQLPEKDYKQFRFEAKAQNFGLIYGMSAPGYQNHARIEYGITLSRKKAEQTKTQFFAAYPKILDYHRIYKAKAIKYGYVRTLFGRKTRLPDAISIDKIKKGHADRNAINSPIQGTAGELTIFAFCLLRYCLDESVLFVNTIHDNDMYYIPDELVKDSIVTIKQMMENLPIKLYFDKELTLPMIADFETSKTSWGQLIKHV